MMKREAHLEEENIHGLFSLSWKGAPHGDQGDRQAAGSRGATNLSPLRAGDKPNNAYAAEVPAVTPIPTYIQAPKPSADEIQRAMQAKAQHDLADSQDSLNVPNEDLFIDSLERLADVEDD
jgi:hypothetical protein